MDKETQPDGGQPRDTTSEPTTSTEQKGTLTKIFAEEDTRNRIILIIAVYAITGLGIGLAGYFTLNAFGGGGSNMGSEFISAVFLIIAVVFVALVGVPIAVLLAPRVSEKLDRPNIETYATMGVGVFVGHLVMFIFTVILIGSNLGGGSGSGADGGMGMGDFFVPMMLAAVGVALAGNITIYLTRNHDL